MELIFFKSWMTACDDMGMTDVQFGQVVRLAVTYYDSGEFERTGDVMVDAAFIFIRQDIDRTREKYDDISRKRSEARRSRLTNVDKNEQTLTNVDKTEQTRHNKDKDKDNNKDNNKDKERECANRTPARPSVEECKAYTAEAGINVDVESWYDYYSSNGWKVGKNPMKDWKACLRNWGRRENEFENQKNKNNGETRIAENFAGL